MIKNKGGRPPKLSPRELEGLKTMIAKGVPKENIMMTYDISLRSYERYKSEVLAENVSDYSIEKLLTNSAKTNEEKFFDCLRTLLNYNGLHQTKKQYVTKSLLQKTIKQCNKQSITFPKGYARWDKLSKAIDKFLELYADDYYVVEINQWNPSSSSAFKQIRIYTKVYEEDIMRNTYFNEQVEEVKHEDYINIKDLKEHREVFGDTYYIVKRNKAKQTLSEGAWFKRVWSDVTNKYDKQEPVDVIIPKPKPIVLNSIKDLDEPWIEDYDSFNQMEDEEMFEWVDELEEVKPTKKQTIHECESCGV